MNILEELAATARERVAAAKRKRPPAIVRREAEALPRKDFPFENAIKNAADIAFICECKKASPSKGVIAPNFLYLDIARKYAAAGAECISVLTEPSRFLGDDRYLAEIAAAVPVPCLRKDFTVDEYMICEAKLLGAAAVLLIVSLLEESELREYIAAAHGLGLSALVEAHDEAELNIALKAGAKLVGVNNRNLKNFSVDINNSLRLRRAVPDDVIFVAESGISSPADVDAARKSGANALLVGEALIRSANIEAKLRELRRK